ncbi:MAG: hypothetical protein KBS67_05915 [Bacteroidales bacterium]|nr:hypothetical protein [Candidatus Cryptobacteroides equifaecalis]
MLALVLIAGAVFVYFKFYFVFGSGVKAGELNQIVYKGWVWKTYEGRLIQTGFKGAKGTGSLQSNEFEFSVVNEEVAKELMRCSGKNVELHYKEYRGMLPWRGMQKYVVDEIVSVNNQEKVETVIPIVPDEA